MNKINLMRNDFEEIIFDQFIHWIEKKKVILEEDYEELWSVAPRRGSLHSKVWIRNSDYKLVVLKAFSNFKNKKSVRRSIINEIIIPYVVNSKFLLKPSNFIIDKDVNTN